MSERAKQIEQLVSLSIIALLIIGSIVLVLPFLPAILWAVVFAVTTPLPLFSNLKGESYEP
jgi:Flp pilus assembly protein TadB